jgi:hypothetical protein
MRYPIQGAVLPLEGVRSFGFQRSATHQHQGIDLPAPEGTPVYAVADGIVRYATSAWRQGFSGYGRVVVVEHAPLGVWTLYAHLSEALVAPGERVTAGEVLGLVGRTAYTHEDHEALFSESGSHLHFEVSPHAYPQDSEAPRINPVAWLQSFDESYVAPPAMSEAEDPPIPFAQPAPAGPGSSHSLPPLSEQPQSLSSASAVHCGSRDCLQHPQRLCGCDCAACLAAIANEDTREIPVKQ